MTRRQYYICDVKKKTQCGFIRSYVTKLWNRIVCRIVFLFRAIRQKMRGVKRENKGDGMRSKDKDITCTKPKWKSEKFDKEIDKVYGFSETRYAN